MGLLDESVLLFETLRVDRVNAAGLLFLRRPRLAKQSNLSEFRFIFQKFNHQLNVDRIGVEVMYQPMIMGASQRPTGQAGFFAFWRTGADVITSNAFKVLKV